MCETTNPARYRPRWRRLLSLVGLIAVSLATGPDVADAAAIRTARIAPARARTVSTANLRSQARAAARATQEANRWDAYYRRALRQQSLRVQVPAQLRGTRALSVAALDPENPYLAYLRWRRSLNPTRFDYYHPNLGSVLDVPPLVNPPYVPDVVPNPNPNPIPQVPQVPEPSSILVLASLFGGAALLRRWGIA